MMADVLMPCILGCGFLTGAVGGLGICNGTGKCWAAARIHSVFFSWPAHHGFSSLVRRSTYDMSRDKAPEDGQLLGLLQIIILIITPIPLAKCYDMSV